MKYKDQYIQTLADASMAGYNAYAEFRKTGVEPTVNHMEPRISAKMRAWEFGWLLASSMEFIQEKIELKGPIFPQPEPSNVVIELECNNPTLEMLDLLRHIRLNQMCITKHEIVRAASGFGFTTTHSGNTVLIYTINTKKSDGLGVRMAIIKNVFN